MRSDASEALRILQSAGLRPPKTLTMAITGACNLSCGHCWVNAGEAGATGHLPERTARRLMEEFVALDGKGIRLTGGEPLCHPAWLQLLRFSRSLGLETVSVQTNGMLLTAASVAALRELDFARLTLQISLDGATAATHDLVRGAGAFERVLEGLKLLVRGGLGDSLSLFFTEMHHNLFDIPALLRLASDLGIRSVVTGSLVRCGRAASGSTLAPPDLEQYRQLLRHYDTDPEFRRLYERIGTVAALEWRREETPSTEHCTFVENPYLTADGKLYPCVMCHADSHAVTGVLGKSLASAFSEGAPLWAELMKTSRSRAESLALCRDCPGRLVCAGGCMGRAWGSCGDFLAVDDRCQIRRPIYQSSCR
ncbi:MAG: radical SAM protein [Desulfuromonadales bacterium]|nr:MAG: radical SAM protein [Desulfuromonadales bacterium]